MKICYNPTIHNEDFLIGKKVEGNFFKFKTAYVISIKSNWFLFLFNNKSGHDQFKELEYKKVVDKLKIKDLDNWSSWWLMGYSIIKYIYIEENKQLELF